MRFARSWRCLDSRCPAFYFLVSDGRCTRSRSRLKINPTAASGHVTIFNLHDLYFLSAFWTLVYPHKRHAPGIIGGEVGRNILRQVRSFPLRLYIKDSTVSCPVNLTFHGRLRMLHSNTSSAFGTVSSGLTLYHALSISPCSPIRKEDRFMPMDFFP